MDKALQKVGNRKEMIAGGWVVDKAPHEEVIHAKNCGGQGFWGYNKKTAVNGYISATFKGSGKAILNFGNCLEGGVTKVTQHFRLIDNTTQKSCIVEINYEKGQLLKIAEENGIIKINSFTLVGCENKGNAVFTLSGESI